MLILSGTKLLVGEARVLCDLTTVLNAFVVKFHDRDLHRRYARFRRIRQCRSAVPINVSKECVRVFNLQLERCMKRL